VCCKGLWRRRGRERRTERRKREDIQRKNKKVTQYIFVYFYGKRMERRGRHLKCPHEVKGREQTLEVTQLLLPVTQK